MGPEKVPPGLEGAPKHPPMLKPTVVGGYIARVSPTHRQQLGRLMLAVPVAPPSSSDKRRKSVKGG